MPCGPPLKDGGKPFGACLQNQIMNKIRITSQKTVSDSLEKKLTSVDKKFINEVCGVKETNEARTVLSM